MKLRHLIAVIAIVFGTAILVFPQQELNYTVTAANANGIMSSIDLPGLTGNPLAIIVATPVGNTKLLNTHPIQAWYYSGKWFLSNSDGERLPIGSKYLVQFYKEPGADRFVHIFTKENIGAEGSYIDHPALNGNPGAQFKILQNHSPEVRSYYLNRNEAQAAYSTAAGRWYIANINGQPIYPKTGYNIVILSGPVASTGNPTPSPRPPTGGVIVPVYPPPYNPNLTPTSTPVPAPFPSSTPIRTPATVPPRNEIPEPVATPNANWDLKEEPQPSIAPNSQVLLFIHGMDSRAEEADDITKALFKVLASGTVPNQTPAPAPPSQTSQMAPVLQQLLKKYKDCILERYETQQDMVNRGLSSNLSGLFSTYGLVPRDFGVACIAGNLCSLPSRLTGYAALQAQADRGDATNFQTNLERVIPKDCFECQKHQERHTKHVHCTMEAGGNSGIIQGPYFEACKAGVDLQALSNIVRSEISAAITSLSGIVPPPTATGGPSVATNRSLVEFTSCPDPTRGCPEPCDHPDIFAGGQRIAVVPTENVNGQRVPLYFSPLIPPGMLDTAPPAGQQINVPAGRNIGSNEGRLRPDLRKAAADGKPLASLRLAAQEFAAGDTAMGNAYSDLSVTGHRAFDEFKVALPKIEFCESVRASRTGPQTSEGLFNGCKKALDRAYRVANYLRTGQRGDSPAEKTRKRTERAALGWIAISGEDDSPHRPVNAPSSDYPQYDINVTVEAPRASGPKSVKVRTRYVIAQSQATGTGKNLVIISLDLPSSGYTQNLDYEDVSPLIDIGQPKWTPLPVPIPIPDGLTLLIPGFPPFPPGTVIPPGTPLPDFEATGRTPLLDFIETFIVNFVDAVEQKAPIKSNFRAVMGGSLGGNMSFRLGRRKNVDWLRNAIVWSPASIWNSLGGGVDILKHIGPRSAFENANAARNTPNNNDRALFFGGWDKPIIPFIIPMAQSDTWTSDYYPCKKSSVAAGRLDRQETYDQRFLAWRWRLGAEQLLFSHQSFDPDTNRPWYMSNQKPMLLACGSEDKVKFNDICPATQTTATLMTMTPGKALFLDKTGHSLDNERPDYFAKQIIQFLGL